MKKIKIAQIGTSGNSHGSAIFKNLTEQSDIFEIVGYCVPENERKLFPKRAAYFDGYREMTVEEILNDPEIEAVTVETEEIYLTKYALMVARAGKHLHMEKPGSPDLAGFEELIKTVKEKNIAFSMGYMYRFNPVFIESVERIRRGELGEIFSVEAHMDCFYADHKREWLSTFPGGMMYFLGCHIIDLIYGILGEPEEVIPLNCSTGIHGVEATDFGMVAYKYKNGVSFAKTAAVERGGYMRRQLVICGEKATIELKPLEVEDGELRYTVYSESDADLIWREEWKTARTESYNRYSAMMQNFARAVRGEKNPYTPDYELGLYKLLLKSCGKEV